MAITTDEVRVVKIYNIFTKKEELRGNEVRMSSGGYICNWLDLRFKVVILVTALPAL
jgi:hypothetical protein